MEGSTWNSAIETTLGYKNDQECQTAEWWLSNLHPDDEQPLHQEIFRAIESNENWSNHYFVDIHIKVKGSMTVVEGHTIAHNVKDRLIQGGMEYSNSQFLRSAPFACSK